jgi:O-antigen/teichoic acid export membrane protein
MSRERKLVFDAGRLFLFGLLASAFGYLIRIILSRQMSLEDFGLFYSVFTFVGFFIVFRDFGLSSALMKFIPEFLVKQELGKVKSSIKFVISINLAVSLVIALLFIFLSNFLVKNYFGNELAKPLLFIMAIYFVLYSLYRVLMNIFVGFQRSEFYSLDLFFINFFVLIGLFVFSKFGIFSPAISYVIAAFIGIVFGFFVLIKLFDFFGTKCDFSGSLRKGLFNYGFPLLLASFGYIVIGQIDVMMLTKFRTLAEVGVYSVVLPTAMLLITIGSSLAEVMIPFVSEYWAAKKFERLKKVIEETYQKAFIFIIPISLVLLVFSDFVITILFGSDFRFGSDALRILSLGSIFFSVATINNSIISAIGKPKVVTKIILVAAVLNVILNLLLIPPYGLIGAAIATTVAYLFVLLLSLYFVQRIIKVKLPIFDWIKTVFAGILFVVVGDFLRINLEMNLWLELFIILVVCILVYLLLLSVMKVVNLRKNISSFVNLIKARL